MFRRRIRRAEDLASLDLAGWRLDYLLKRSSARRTLTLKINAQGQAQVNAPLAMPLAQIETFLRRHVDWLRDRLQRQPAAFAWEAGARLPYLGGELYLELASSNPSPATLTRAAAHPSPLEGEGLGERGRRHPRSGQLDHDRVQLLGDRLLCTATDVEAAVLAWYRRQARQVLGASLVSACRELGLATPPWRLSSARTRWGSLSAKGVVGLNWRLVKASRAEIDYVIRHELAHFKHRDHSPAYWREVERLCPDYRAARARLRAHGAAYMAV